MNAKTVKADRRALRRVVGEDTLILIRHLERTVQDLAVNQARFSEVMNRETQTLSSSLDSVRVRLDYTEKIGVNVKRLSHVGRRLWWLLTGKYR
jgi:hypothetical protein